MKILMVNKFLYPRGGSESYMLKLGSYFEKMGHQVEYFGMYDEKNTVGNSLRLYTENLDFHSNSAKRFLYPFKIIYSREASVKIGKILDSFKPDVVHMNNINFQLTPSIIYAVKKRGIALVQTVHDYQMICPNHLFYSFQENKPCERCTRGSLLNCVKHKCIHGSRVKSILGALEAKLYSLLKTYRLVDLYICPSKFLEKKLTSASDIYKDKTFVLHNFIEKKNIEKKQDNSKPYIFFAGRLSAEKGVKLLAETAKLLPHIDFVVAGSGPDEDKLCGIPNVKLTGFLNGSELTEKMANAAALIAPSVCYENCPLSILEAHSMGVPAITMNSGGMAELVEDGVTGALIESPCPKDVARATEKTLENEYYQKVLEGCRKRKESIMGVEEYGSKILSVYMDIINGSEHNAKDLREHNYSGV